MFDNTKIDELEGSVVDQLSLLFSNTNFFEHSRRTEAIQR